MAGFSAQQAEQPTTTTEAKSAKAEEHGISQKASEIGRIPTPFAEDVAAFFRTVT